MSDATPNVCFCTDVEGNWEYFCRFVELSDALSFVHMKFDEAGAAAELLLKDGWMFVFGGDAVDKGPDNGPGGSIRFVRTLVALKEKYGDRVVLILGNRDINKMRLTSELAEAQLALLHQVAPPYWVPPKSQVTLVSSLARTVGSENPAALAAANTATNRLRWILSDTMGAAGEFERRKQELELLRGDAVSDDEVCADFVRSVGQGGFMRRLLELGQMAAIVGCTLYVHGGLCGTYRDGATDCIGYVPGYVPVAGAPLRIEDAAEWVDALNRWAREQVRSWVEHPEWAATAPAHGTPACAKPAACPKSVAAGAPRTGAEAGMLERTRWAMRCVSALRPQRPGVREGAIAAGRAGGAGRPSGAVWRGG